MISKLYKSYTFIIIIILQILTYNAVATKQVQDITAPVDIGPISGSCNQPLDGTTTVCTFGSCEDVQAGDSFVCMGGTDGNVNSFTAGPLIEPNSSYRASGPSQSSTAPVGNGGAGGSLPAYMLDDSCIDQQTLLGIIVNLVLTFGQDIEISQNFSMTDVQAEGLPSCQLSQFTDNTGGKCSGMLSNTCGSGTCAGRCITRCDIPTNSVCFIYSAAGNNILTCLEDGQTATVYPDPTDTVFTYVTFQANINNDMLCVKYQSTLSIDWVTLGCRFTRDQSAPTTLGTQCYISTACFSSAESNTQVFFAISSVIVECFQSTINSIFYPSSATAQCPSSVSSLPQIQASLKSTVFAALTLYIIFFAIHTVVSGHAPSSGEVISFILKMILVINFSVGLSPDCNDVSISCNALQWIYESLISVTNGFSSMLINAPGAANACDSSTASGLCVYPESTYAPGYQFLSLWDSLDCRVGFYFGLYNPSQLILVLLILIIVAFTTWWIMALAAGGILFAAFTIGFGLLTLDLVIGMVQITIISMFAVAILVYLAPIMVPMVLFEATKDHFEKWLSLLISFTLQPMILALFIALLFSIFDNLMYSTCCWDQKSVAMPVAGFPGNVDNGVTSSTINAVQLKCYTFFLIQSPTDPTLAQQCQNSFGWAMNAFTDGDVESFLLLFFPIASLSNPNQFLNLLLTIVMLLVFAYVAWEFIDLLASFSSDLVGGGFAMQQNQLKQNIKATFQKAGKAAHNLAKYKYGADKNKDTADKGKKRDDTKPSVSMGGGEGGGGKSSGGGASDA